MTLDDCRWSTDAVGGALTVLINSSAPAPAPLTGGDDDALAAWLDLAVAQLGAEVEYTQTPYEHLGETLRQAAPALLVLPEPDRADRVLVLTGRRRDKLRLQAPDGAAVWLPHETVRRALAAELEAGISTLVLPIVEHVPPGRRAKAEAALMASMLQGQPCTGVWQLRLPPQAGALAQLREAGLLRYAGLIVGSHAASYGLFVLSWALSGRGALSGELTPGWLAAWALVLLAGIPLRLLTTWSQGVFALGAGALLKRRLLLGALRLSPDETRTDGIGLAMGRVNEAEAIEALALSGGIAAALALVELLGAAWVIAQGSGGLLMLGALGLWLAVIAALSARYVAHRREWTRLRMTMTGDLVERMAGHRTRLAQQPPDRWHREEDHQLSQYLDASAQMDATVSHLMVSLPRGWTLLAILSLGPAFASGATPAALAVGLGGALLAGRALDALTNGIAQLAGAQIAHERIRSMLQAATRPRPIGDPGALTARTGEVLVDARDLSFRYPTSPAPILRGARLQIRPGDRLLLEGGSGSGKSTLAALLVGHRAPDSGLLLLGGLDRSSLGDAGWRRRVVSAPQFHENHVLANTFLFNLLMGSGWPPRPGDERRAREICEALGLGPLLQRMPGGILQPVGETGWQLSHGEKSRLFIARAILQDADLVILDESFAALDPVNLDRAMRCVLERAKTVLVIAHP